MAISCACFKPVPSPISNYLCHAPDLAGVKTIFNVSSYYAVLVRDSNLSPFRQLAFVWYLSLCIIETLCGYDYMGKWLDTQQWRVVTGVKSIIQPSTNL